MKKILSLLFCFAVFTTINAATYLGFKVAGIKITSDNYNQPITSEYITANDDSKPFSVTYDHSTATLTLKNVEIKRTGSYNRAIYNESCTNLIIVFEDYNYLEAINSSPVRLDANTTIKSPDGHVTIMGGYEDGLTVGNGATLTIDNADISCYTSNQSFSSRQSAHGTVGDTGNEKLIIKNSIFNSSGYFGYALKDFASVNVQSSYFELGGSGAGIDNSDGAPANNIKAFTYSGDKFLMLGAPNYRDSFEEEGGGFDIVYSSSKKTFVENRHGNEFTNGVIICKAIDFEKNRSVVPDERFAFELQQQTKYWYSYWSVWTDHRYFKYPFKSYNGNANEWEELALDDKGLTSLKGIEFLTELKKLSVNRNNIGTVDLSNNTKLKELYCTNCGLNELNLDQLSALVKFNCDSNSLTSLNLSHNNYITDLSCNNNQIADITFGTYSRVYLERFWCKNNKLTSLSLSDCYNLQLFNCSNNLIEGNMSLYCQHLKYYYCDNNKLSSLSGLTNCPALEILDCSYNQIASLDLTKNTQLIDLRCNNNKLYTLNLKWNNNLAGHTVYCQNNKISKVGLDNLIANLPAVNANLYFMDHKSSVEENESTDAQVTAAQQNGWTTYHYWKPSANGEWDWSPTSKGCLNYGIWIAGERLCSHMASNTDRLIPNVTGTWRYSKDDKWLLLLDVNINNKGIKVTDPEALLIYIDGTNNITNNTGEGLNLNSVVTRITKGPNQDTHNLNISSISTGIKTSGNYLNIDGVNLSSESRSIGLAGKQDLTEVNISGPTTVVRLKGNIGNGIRNVNVLNLSDGLAITEPEGVTFVPNVGFVQNGNEVAGTWVTISKASSIPGDVNGDGECTGSDVTALYNYILYNDSSAIVNGDQNGDGEVTGSDVTAVYNIILGL